MSRSQHTLASLFGLKVRRVESDLGSNSTIGVDAVLEKFISKECQSYLLCTDGSTTKGSCATCCVLNNDHSNQYMRMRTLTYNTYITLLPTKMKLRRDLAKKLYIQTIINGSLTYKISLSHLDQR